MRVSPYVKFTYKEYLALGEYLTEKNTDKELYNTLVEILECFELNKSINRDIDREKDYIKPKNDSSPGPRFSTFLKEEELYKEFRQRYLKLKEKLGSDGIKITYLEIILRKSYLAEHINIEYLNTKQLPDSVKKKLYATLSEKERVEKYIYKKILNEFENENIKKQYIVEKKYGKYKIDFYFIDCKVAVEIDEWGHQGYYRDHERESFIEKKLGCVFVRINPFAGDESIDNFIKRLKKVVEKQKRKYQYSFSEDSLKKLDEIAYLTDCSVDEIINKMINETYAKTVRTYKKQISIS